MGHEGQTALHLACDVNIEDEACVKLLVSNGAGVHAQDTSLRTPLLHAACVNAQAAARFLMESTDASLKVYDEGGMSVIHWFSSFGACELLALALQKGAEVDVPNNTQQTPLHIAITKGNIACALVLLDAGAKPSALDEERRCAMHLAMQYSGGMGQCSESTLLLLRLLQLDTSCVTLYDADKRTPLHWACGKNALPCVRALIKSGAVVDAVDWAGRCALHWAVLVDASESTAELLAAGADPTLKDRDQRTALHWAADRASERCLKQLLGTQLGADVDAADWGGHSALHYAARRGAVGCVKLLLTHGASRRLLAMNGELPTDLTTCEVTKALLTEQVGMKRQRSFSASASSGHVLFSVLPDLARQFYEEWSKGDVSEKVASNLKDEESPAGKLLKEQMRLHKTIEVQDLAVCTKTSKVVVEIKGNTELEKAMHSLTFTEEGLVSSFVPYGLVRVTSAEC